MMLPLQLWLVAHLLVTSQRRERHHGAARHVTRTALIEIQKRRGMIMLLVWGPF
jgi:hypothetical protein